MFFAQRGWRVCVLDRDAEAVDEVRVLLGEAHLARVCDVASEPSVKAAFEAAEAWSGGVDCLVNNAGIANPHSAPLGELSLANWQSVIDANLTGAFLCSRAALPLLRKREGASIVNIASTRALQSEANTFAYSASKGGLCALTHAMAVSLGPEIRVNAILPGWIETGPWQRSGRAQEPKHSGEDEAQHPAGRVGRVEDVAAAILWLVDAGFVTGAQIVVDGGMTRKMIYAD